MKKFIAKYCGVLCAAMFVFGIGLSIKSVNMPARTEAEVYESANIGLIGLLFLLIPTVALLIHVKSNTDDSREW